MKKRHSLLIVGLLLISSCSFHSSSHLQEEFRDVDGDELLSNYSTLDIINSNYMFYTVPSINPNEHRMCRIEQLFDSVFVVRLETNEDNIIGKIDGLTILNDTIYILDSWSTKSVRVFDMAGRFIRSIGNVGNGPGEYVEPTSFSVNQNSILIYDQWQHKVLRYDHSGHILADNRLPFLCFYVTELVGGDILCYGNDEDNEHLPEILDYKFWVCDSSYSRIKKIGYHYPHKKYERIMIRCFNNYNGKCYYFDYKDNTYYQIEESGVLNQLFSLKFQKGNDDRFYRDSEYMKELIQNGDMYPITNCLLLNDIVNYSMPTNGPVEHVFSNTKDGTTIHFSSTDIVNSNLSRVLFIDKMRTCYKDKFVYCLSPERILDVNKQLTSQIPDLWDGAPEHVREFDKKLLDALQDEDNDILIFAKVKTKFD